MSTLDYNIKLIIHYKFSDISQRVSNWKLSISIYHLCERAHVKPAMKGSLRLQSEVEL